MKTRIRYVEVEMEARQPKDPERSMLVVKLELGGAVVQASQEQTDGCEAANTIPTRVDERVETEARVRAGSRLDELAKAVEKYNLEQGKAKDARNVLSVEEEIKVREKGRKWAARLREGGWVVALEIIKEVSKSSLKPVMKFLFGL